MVLHSLTHSLTAALDQLRVVASSTSTIGTPMVKNSQKTVKTAKMTIGVPIVTFLHRVRRIHKAAWGLGLAYGKRGSIMAATTLSAGPYDTLTEGRSGFLQCILPPQGAPSCFSSTTQWRCLRERRSLGVV